MRGFNSRQTTDFSWALKYKNGRAFSARANIPIFCNDTQAHIVTKHIDQEIYNPTQLKRLEMQADDFAEGDNYPSPSRTKFWGEGSLTQGSTATIQWKKFMA